MQLYLFGSPRLEQNGKAIKFDTRKALALLAYLAVTKETQSRDSLATLFWPDYEQSKARAALRRTLSTLKNGLGDGILTISRESVAIATETNLVVDVQDFQTLVTQKNNLSSHEKAALLYQDDFLAGFSLRDSPNFDDWQFFQQEHYKQSFSKTLETLVEAKAHKKTYEAALPYAKLWLEIDVLNERAQRWLMKLFALTNQRTAALRQYRECVRILDEELGVSPLEETNLLYKHILENQLEASGGLKETPKLSTKQNSTQLASLQDLPFIGREQELQKLQTIYDSAAPNGFFTVIEGEAGIGKTRLINEFLELVSDQAKVLNLQCYEGEMQLAYGPFIEGFRKALIEQRTPVPEALRFWLSELSRLLPELHNIYPDLLEPLRSNSPGAQSRFFEACTQVLLYILKQDQPGILIIEDIHLADDASLELLTYFVKRLDQKPVLILGSWRSEQVAYKQNLRQLLHDSQLSLSLKLTRLNKKEVQDLIAAAPVDLSPTSSQNLINETQGVPFFLVAYLAKLIQNPAEASSIPKGIQALLTSRFETTDDLARQLLSTAAVIGRSFSFDSLRLSAGRSEEETIEGIETLLAHDLISELPEFTTDPSYDFRHSLLRTLIYENMSLARKRLLHRRVAEALAQPSKHQTKDQRSAKIAQHYQLAGQDELAAQYFAQAGHQAKALYANSEAIALFKSALALGHPSNSEVQTAIGDLYMLKGDYASALNTFEKAAAQSEGAALAALEHKLAELHSRLGAWEIAENHFTTSLKLLEQEDDTLPKINLLVDWSRLHYQKDDLTNAFDLAEKAFNLTDDMNIEGLARTHNMLGVLAQKNKDFKQARFHLEKSLEQTSKLEHQFVEVAVLNNLALLHASDDPEKAIDFVKRALEICKSQGDRHREAALHNNLADLYHRFDQAEKSMFHLKQAVTIFSSIGANVQPEIWKLATW